MNAPPMILDLKVDAPDRTRPLHLWLPLFLLWPLLLVLGVLVLVFTILADVVLFLLGQRYHAYTSLVLGSFWLLCETRGVVVRIHNDQTTVDMTVR